MMKKFAFIWEYGFRLGPATKKDRARNPISRLNPPAPHWKDRYSCFWTNDSGELKERIIADVLRNFTFPRTGLSSIQQIQRLNEKQKPK